MKLPGWFFPQLIVLLAINGFLSSCAINEFGLVSVKKYENETLRLIKKEAWGAYVSTDETDRGLTIGHTERMMVLPKKLSSRKIMLNDLFLNPSQGRFLEIQSDEIKEDGNQTAIVFFTNQQGLAFNASKQSSGLIFGLKSIQTLSLPEDFAGIFFSNMTQTAIFLAFIRLIPNDIYDESIKH
ncbi:MAG: hypothetical protein IPN42_03065 [Methylococcaceae bacterium]|nr:hypothetical protein [Methylococcaceae bacterium]